MNTNPSKPKAADNTAGIQRGRSFKAGQSGNPAGRPKGSRNKATLAAEALLEGELEAIIRKLLEKAKEGDSSALRLCLDRLMPPRRDRSVTFDLGPLRVQQSRRRHRLRCWPLAQRAACRPTKPSKS